MNFAFAAAHVRQRSRAYLGRPCCLLRPAASEARPHCIGLPPCCNHRSTAVPASSGCSLARRQRSPAPLPALARCLAPQLAPAPQFVPASQPARPRSLPGPAACPAPLPARPRCLPGSQPARLAACPARCLHRPRCPVRSRHWLAPAPLSGLAAREARPCRPRSAKMNNEN